MWQDALAILNFHETHGRMPEPGEETLEILAAHFDGSGSIAQRYMQVASHPARADVEESSLRKALEAVRMARERRMAVREDMESRMNPQSREAVRRRRRSLYLEQMHGS